MISLIQVVVKCGGVEVGFFFKYTKGSVAKLCRMWHCKKIILILLKHYFGTGGG